MSADPLLARYGTQRNGHSLFAPSASAGWLNCSGFLLANAKSRDTAGIDAAYGTVAHDMAHIWHTQGKQAAYANLGDDLKAKAGGQVFHIEVDSAMLEHVGRYVQWCDEVPGDHYYEQRVDFGDLMPIPGQGGTADHFACENGILTITDLKMGTGVRVFAKDNSQAMLYAIGVFREWDWIYGFQRIVIRICQPRLDVFETWECSRQELLEFGAHVRTRARAAWDEAAARTPSPKACQWCKALASCPARLRELDNIVDQTFDNMCLEDRGDFSVAGIKDVPPHVVPADFAAPGHLGTATLAATLGLRAHVDKWFAAIADELLQRAEKGEEIPFFKLTNGRTKRYYDDTSAVLVFVAERYGLPKREAAPPKLLSPSAMEALIRRRTKDRPKDIAESLSRFVSRVSAKRALAPAGDERPDVFGQAEDDFDVEDEDL